MQRAMNPEIGNVEDQNYEIRNFTFWFYEYLEESQNYVCVPNTHC